MEKIDELRVLLEAHNRRGVSCVWLAGSFEIPHEMWIEHVDSGDRAIVFLGPKDKLTMTRTENQADGTITFTVVMPKD